MNVLMSKGAELSLKLREILKIFLATNHAPSHSHSIREKFSKNEYNHCIVSMEGHVLCEVRPLREVVSSHLLTVAKS